MRNPAKLLAGALVLSLCAMSAPALRVAIAHDAADAHAQHHHSQAPEMIRSMAEYTAPQVTLVRAADGKSVSLPEELNDGRPVVLNFIYTTCTSICPISSQTFSELQGKLGARGASVHLVSISIDPEQDTPARLREYAKRFGAAAQWQFYTGTLAASTAAQRAFGVYRGEKMNHAPVTLVRAAPGAQWVRLDGFATADELLEELHAAVASK